MNPSQFKSRLTIQTPEEKNDIFSTLYRSLQHEVFSHLDTYEYGRIASVSKAFNEIVFPKPEKNEEINPNSNYRGFLSSSLVRKLIDPEMSMKWLIKITKMVGGEINEEFIPSIELKFNKLASPVINMVSGVFAKELYRKKNITNKQLAEMNCLASNPMFKTLFNLVADVGLNVIPTLENIFNDEEFKLEVVALSEEFQNEVKEAQDKSKNSNETNEKINKDEHSTKLIHVHGELKNRVAKIAPTTQGIAGVPPPVPAVLIIPAAGGFGTIGQQKFLCQIITGVAISIVAGMYVKNYLGV